MLVNPDTQKVRTSDAITLTRKACGDIDTPLAETVKGADHLTAHTNNDSLLVTFRDEQGEALFSMQRPLADGEKENFKLKNAAQAQRQSTSQGSTQGSSSNAENTQPASSGFSNFQSASPSTASTASNVSIANFLVGRYNP